MINCIHISKKTAADYAHESKNYQDLMTNKLCK
jgi:hypothetical protein